MKSTDIESLISWLSTNPAFVTQFDVTRDNAEQLIDFVGTDLIQSVSYIRHGSKTILRNNYILQVERPYLKLVNRKENSDFLSGFVDWVADQSERGLVPRFGNYGKQKAWVDSQEFLDIDESRKTGIYQLQLHIEYAVLR